MRTTKSKIMADPVNEVVMEGKGKEEEEKKEQLAPGVELEETHCYGMTDQGEDIPADDEEEEEEVEENKEENGEENKPKKKKRGGRKKVKVDPRSKMEYLDEVQTKQNKTKQNKTKQNKTKQNKTKQIKTNQNKSKQIKTNQNKSKSHKQRHTNNFSHIPPFSSTSRALKSPLSLIWERFLT